MPQRPLKFRAWNTQSKTVYSAEELTKGRIILAIDGNGMGYMANGKFLRISRLIPLQYTGLNDANGREIYEGDILVLSYAVSHPYPARFFVKYDEGSYSLYLKDGEMPFDSLYTSAKMVVVGNIYENPELLEETQ
jgi:uncharacterized phage protein (TIGR01671 family)